MTYEDIIHEYKKLFIMLVEKAGRETGNTSYQRIEKILETDNAVILEKEIIETEPGFVIIVCNYLILLFCDIYGIDVVGSWDEVKGAEKVNEFYQLYLKNSTIRFCEKYGLEPFEDPNISFKLILNKHGEDNNKV